MDCNNRSLPWIVSVPYHAQDIAPRLELLQVAMEYIQQPLEFMYSGGYGHNGETEQNTSIGHLFKCEAHLTLFDFKPLIGRLEYANIASTPIEYETFNIFTNVNAVESSSSEYRWHRVFDRMTWFLSISLIGFCFITRLYMQRYRLARRFNFASNVPARLLLAASFSSLLIYFQVLVSQPAFRNLDEAAQAIEDGRFELARPPLSNQRSLDVQINNSQVEQFKRLREALEVTPIRRLPIESIAAEVANNTRLFTVSFNTFVRPPCSQNLTLCSSIESIPLFSDYSFSYVSKCRLSKRCRDRLEIGLLFLREYGFSARLNRGFDFFYSYTQHRRQAHGEFLILQDVGTIYLCFFIGIILALVFFEIERSCEFDFTLKIDRTPVATRYKIECSGSLKIPSCISETVLCPINYQK